MSDRSLIEWTDSTWNPVTGCTKVSAGCKNCYAERLAPRLGQDFSEIILHPDRLDAPLHWRKPRRIFVNSLSDLFHEDVPDDFIANVFSRMNSARQHIFQVLTKRPERMLRWFSRCGNGGGLGWITHNNTEPVKAYRGTGIIVGTSDRWPLPNVWLGISCEDQQTADERILLLIQTPAAVRFISAEPLLGPIKLTAISDHTCPKPASRNALERQTCSSMPMLDWVIVGGESGPGARPMHPNWARSLRDQCQAAGVPFFFKQWGEWCPVVKQGEWWRGQNNDQYPDQRIDGFVRPGKHAAGRILDGRTWDEMPKEEL
jgi:protein gp37